MNTDMQIIPFLTILLIATKKERWPMDFLTNVNFTMVILLVKTEKSTVDQKLDR